MIVEYVVKQKQKYVVFHPYLPEYDIQGRPIAISYEEIKEKGWKRALEKARKNFLKYDLKPTKRIHPKHLELIDKIVSRKTVIRELTPEQAKRIWMGKKKKKP